MSHGPRLGVGVELGLGLGVGVELGLDVELGFGLGLGLGLGLGVELGLVEFCGLAIITVAPLGNSTHAACHVFHVHDALIRIQRRFQCVR